LQGDQTQGSSDCKRICVQEERIDFEEVFALDVSLESVRVIHAITSTHGWHVHRLDVKSAFLNGELKEEVYVAEPEGFTIKNNKHMVFMLHKALYGLLQAPHDWYSGPDSQATRFHAECTRASCV
jgi:hypothetical protein